jgi:hypothetical protein
MFCDLDFHQMIGIYFVRQSSRANFFTAGRL